MRCLALIVAALTVALLWSSSSSAQDWRAYAKREAAKVGWVGGEWQALDAIVVPESRWNPCAHWRHKIECGYDGPNSCGIPQRNPCPSAWRGRLGSTGRMQVAELLRYVRDRYGSPSAALAFRRAHGYY